MSLPLCIYVQTGTYESANELADRPPNGQHSEQPLMCRRDELEEYCRVDWKVTAAANRIYSDECAQRNLVVRTTCSKGKYTGDEQSEVE